MEYSPSIKERIVQSSDSILFALKKMDAINKKLLLVFDKESFFGVLSIGDIQKAIISNVSFDIPVNLIMRKEYVYANETDSKSDVLEMMKKHRIECMPVLNKKKELITAFVWDDVFDIQTSIRNADLDLPVIIMAGGKGTRLRPLTNVIPKPLIPIGELTIIETIMDNFCEVGCNKFYISVNYKAEIIRYYLSSLNHERYQIEYIQESIPLGTAGSLHLLKGKINSTFFISNCDIIIEQNIADILEYHRSYKNEITVVAAIKNYSIPYGICNTNIGGQLIGLSEKPDITFKINTGFYILEPNLLNEIPENEFYHITTLIEKLIRENRKVGVFPVSEKSWRDIGEWSEYLKLI